MEIEKIIKKRSIGQNTTYVEDQFLAVYEFAEDVLKNGKFLKDSVYSKNAYIKLKELLVLTTKDADIEIPYELTSLIKKVDAIAVKEYKIEIKQSVALGVFFILMGIVSYFLIYSLIFTILVPIVGIYWIVYALELHNNIKRVLLKK